MMAFPSLAHVIYIPFILGLGFLVGWNLGTRNVRGEWDRAERRRRVNEERRS